MNSTLKVGRITVAVSLVAFGVGLLLDNIGVYTGALSWVARLWPLMLIGFGVEYLLFSVLGARGDQPRRLRFDIGGAFLLAFMVLVSVGITTFQAINWPDGIRFNVPLGAQASVSGGETVALDQAREVVADVDVGTIVLQPSVREGEVRIDYTYTANGLTVSADAEELLSQIKLRVDNTGETLRIKAADVPRNLNNVSLHYTLYVPAGLNVKLQTGAGRIESTGYNGTMDLTSNVGRIEVRGGEGALTAASGSGQILVRDFDGPVTAKTNVGSLEMTNVNGALQLDSGTGSIVVRDFRGGQLMAETRTGRIDASTGYALEGNVSLKASTGSVVLNAPQSSVRATAQTRTGGLTAPAFMSVTRSGTGANAVGTFGDGKYTVSLEANTGSVTYTTR